ncbi:MAG: helix-turn-helix transcriptional regulator, partial [Ktedonobacteraceae bacterium]|nr:helix-turn-helix transcriptional regulator [Ktedonobacteraceae bacterium]
FSDAWEEGSGMTPEQAFVLREQSEQFYGDGSNKRGEVKIHERAAHSLTRREVEVLRLVVQGYPDAQIAERLVISPRTVHAHLRSIYRKLGISSRFAAIHYALDEHIV